jgi:lysophospholipase L1-like esterase
VNTASNITVKIIALAAAFAGGFAARPSIYQFRDKMRMTRGGEDAGPGNPAQYAHRSTHFADVKSACPIVFVGDSRIEGAEWAELLGADISNRGIGGDTTRGVLDRIESSVPAGTRVCLVQVGFNDLYAGMPPDKVAVNLATIAKSVKAARVIVTSIIPASSSSKYLDPRIAEVNEKAAVLVKQAGAEWLDLSPVFGGELSAEFTADGIHLNGFGYRMLADPIRKAINDS